MGGEHKVLNFAKIKSNVRSEETQLRTTIVDNDVDCDGSKLHHFPNNADSAFEIQINVEANG